MLSKTERNYLSGKYLPSSSYKRYLHHKIKKKLKEFYQLELPLIQNSSVSDFTNVVSEFTNGIENPYADSSYSRSKKHDSEYLQEGKGLGGLRSLDLAVRSRSHYPDCATSPKK